MPIESQILERFHELDKRQEADAGRVDAMERDRGHVWTSIGKLEELVNNIRVDVAKAVVISTMVQTVIVGGLLYFFTKGQ